MLPILKDMRNMLWVFEMLNVPKIGPVIEVVGRPHTEPILKEKTVVIVMEGNRRNF